MAFIIKVITDAISKDILIAPSPKPSHFPTKKLINNKIILMRIRIDGIPYCKGAFFLLKTKETPNITIVRITVSSQNDDIY